MRIVCEGDPDYDNARKISNARFDHSPRCIYYCESADDVKKAIADSGGKPGAVRIRSGGHQHEGMCTADDILVIDLSSINDIDFSEEDQRRVWIGAGASLSKIYGELWARGYLFAGGGCPDVHVGGLAHGGGWGPAGRKFGLTCDSLIGAEIVTAKRECHRIPRLRHPEDRALLQALRGGGGGNFGVVTKFCFRLHPWQRAYADITLTWSDQQLPGASLDRLVLHWMKTFPRDRDNNLTTFLRITVAPGPAGDRLVLGGRYLGTVYEAQAAIDRLLKGRPNPKTATYQASPFRGAAKKGAMRLAPHEREAMGRRLATLPEYQPGPGSLDGAATDADNVDLSNTCGGDSIRHKVSSGFVRRQVNPKLVPALTNVIRKSVGVLGARQYVSLHCLGGAIFNEPFPSAYAFRDRIVLFQYQAWWQPRASQLDEGCIKWVEKVRKTMTPYTDGAFINFADRDIALDEYYKDKLEQLKAVKKQWDADDLFHFKMGIPPKK